MLLCGTIAASNINIIKLEKQIPTNNWKTRAWCWTKRFFTNKSTEECIREARRKATRELTKNMQKQKINLREIIEQLKNSNARSLEVLNETKARFGL